MITVKTKYIIELDEEAAIATQLLYSNISVIMLKTILDIDEEVAERLTELSEKLPYQSTQS